jgi:hypothetical protein
MVQVWSENMINPNLLDDTEFLDDNHVDGWSRHYPNLYFGEHGSGSENTTFDNTYTSNKNGGVSSVYHYRYNEYYITYTGKSNTPTCNATEGVYIAYLAQQLYGTGTTDNKKLSPSTWYTLSFLAYGKCRGDSTAGSNTDTLCIFVNGGVDTSAKLTWIEQIGTSTPTTTTNTTTNRNINFEYTGSNTGSWTRVTVTFKTLSSLTKSSIELRIYPKTYKQTIYIREPKLEVGKIATEYVPGSAICSPYPRTSAWEVGKQYYQGVMGEPYLDIVTYGGNWFRCRQTHVSRAAYTDTGGTFHQESEPAINTTTTYWEPAENLSFIATDLVLAETAFIENLVATKLRTGPIGTAHVEMENSKVAFYGLHETPSIVLDVDSDEESEFYGCGILRFYDADNHELYNLGPGGLMSLLKSIDNEESKFSTILYKEILDGDGLSAVLNVYTRYATTFYKFSEGYTAQYDSQTDTTTKTYYITHSTSPSSYNGKLYLDNSHGALAFSNYPDSWKPGGSVIGGATTADCRWFVEPNNGVYGEVTTDNGGTPSFNALNPSQHTTDHFYFIPAFRYVNGKMTKRKNIYFYSGDNIWRDLDGNAYGGLGSNSDLLDYLNA